MALSRGSRWFLAFAMLGLAGIAAGLWWLDTSIFDDGVEPGQPVEFTVERGQTVAAVGDALADEGVVGSGFRFRVAADEAGLAETLQPGVFELETGMEIDDAVEALAAGPTTPPTVRFTVPEGLTIDQTLERLAEQFDAYDVDDFRLVLDARRRAADDPTDELRLPDFWPPLDDLGADVDEPFEGLLWPQTYEIDDTATPQEILQRMVDQLDTEVENVPLDVQQVASDAGRDAYDTLTLASLIERETRLADERATIAGVLANRLDEGMRLQVDATVVYALGEDADGRVLLEDLEVDSPYNTYEIEGLPPTPISGVGTAALEAAFAPEDVPYLFYALDPACDGSHRFAETSEEHEANVAALREVDSCQGEPDVEFGGGG